MPLDLHSEEGRALKKSIVEELKAFATKHNGQEIPVTGNYGGLIETLFVENALPPILYAMLKKMESMQVEIDILKEHAK